MPIKKAAIKFIRQTKKRTVRNKLVKAKIKQTRLNFKKALIAGDKNQAQDSAQTAVKLLDKAAQKGVIKKNKAARLKSRLLTKLNVFLASLKSEKLKEPS